MCKLFIEADDGLWECHSRSLRIDGVSTSIRMEAFFWMTLEDIADRDGMNVNQLITRLYLEAMEADHDMGNFTSFLRVCCGRYLALMAAGDLSRDRKEPIQGVDADYILARETRRHQDMLQPPKPTRDKSASSFLQQTA